MNPQDLKQIVSSGLLSFPLTDFDKELRFAPKPYAQRLEWLLPYGATALFAAGALPKSSSSAFSFPNSAPSKRRQPKEILP